jgi:uncharacterized protein YkwD
MVCAAFGISSAALGISSAAGATAHSSSRTAAGKRSTSARGRSSASSRAKARAERRRLAAARSRERAKHAAAKRPPSKSGTILRETPQTQAVTIAKVLATPCQNTQLLPEPGNLELVDAAVLCLVNTKRAQNGEVPLQPNAQLEQAAQSHAHEMISLNYFEHVSPNGLTPVQRIRTTGYIPNGEVGYVIGENLAWGTLSLSTPQAIVSAWIASPGHLANILESKYRDTGINVLAELPTSLAENTQGALYTQEFGVIVE